MTGTGAFTFTSGTATKNARTYRAGSQNESGVLVKGGSLTLRHARVFTSGNTSSQDASSFYGLNAGVLVFKSGKVTLVGATISTTGTGANGLFAYGSGASASMSGGTIIAKADGGHGVMASGGAKVTIQNVSIATAGRSGAALATDRGGGTVSAAGGTMTTTGAKSPGIYSTGEITVIGSTMLAKGAEAAVVEGANSITVTGAKLSASAKGGHGVMLYNSMSGDASAGTGHYTMRGGSLTAAGGPAFYVTNTKAVITVSGGARIKATSHVLLRADSAGTGSGNTGAGTVTLTALGEHLSGDLVTAGTGTIAANLRDSAILTGTINRAALTIDAGSVWKVTGNSTLSSLSDRSGISGTSIRNIVGNGHTVTYDAGLAANSALGGRTYKLSGGGTLRPA